MSKDLIEKQLTDARHAYYNTGSPLMGDEEFDALVERARAMGIDVDSVVGSPAVGTDGSVSHKIPMLSLLKVTTPEGVAKFVSEVEEGVRFLVQAKLDGVSLSLSYTDGKLVRALTRGDGVKGEDVTHIVSLLPSVPSELPQPLTGEVRGEVVIHKAELDAKFKNTRNSVAGLLNARTKSPDDAARYKCRFYAFELLGTSAHESVTADQMLRNLGFENPSQHICYTLSEVQLQIESILAFRSTLPYDIDGVVVKVVEFAVRKRMGSRSNSPRWAFAFKPESETAVTRLNGVTWQVGSGGQATPVAELEPVDLMGTTIARASLHNPLQIQTLGICIGDEVVIKRANDVIPQVVGVSVPAAYRTEIVTPRWCPACSTPLVQEGNSGQVQCPDSSMCPAQVRGRLLKWAARPAADMDAIGPVWVEKFVDRGLVKSPADFYALTEAGLSGLDGMGPKNPAKFLKNIEKSKALGMRRALIGFAIPNASDGTAKRLCWNFSTVEEVASATEGQLMSIEDIGPVVAASIRRFFQSAGTLLGALRAAGVNLDRLPEDAPASATASLAGKTFVITGAVSNGRAAFSKELEVLGAKVSGSVSANTTALITDDQNATSGKAKQARELGVPFLTEAQVRAMF
jgi:DNA ligase (NAD+)